MAAMRLAVFIPALARDPQARSASILRREGGGGGGRETILWCSEEEEEEEREKEFVQSKTYE
jgi:hypothetical protein